MFIASIVRNYLFQGLKKVSKKEKDKKSYTVPASISELEKVTIVKNSKDVYIRRYGLTKKQRSILTQFGDAVTIGSAPNCDIIFNDTQVAPQNSRVFVRNQMINAVQPKLIGVAGREVVCLC